MAPQRGHKCVQAEEKIQEALAAIRAGSVPSAYAAEKKFGVSRVLLCRRLKGTQMARHEAHEGQQLLTEQEEEALVKWCRQLTIAGYPARHSVLREMAEEIRTRRLASINRGGEVLVQYPPIGVNWTARFLLRHPQLNTVVSQQLDLARWKDPTREALTHWFTTFQDQTKDIPLRNVYNMDETGFSIGTEECSRVIIDQGTLQTRYKTHPGRQEWVSVVECICADGTAVPPLFLFKAEGVNANLITDELPDDWNISGTSQGWTSNIHGVEWLVKCFEPYTREKAGGQPRVLFCDGHDSHITGNFIAHCMDHNIRLLIMPPHASHLLQPLDLSVFGPLKTYLGRESDRITRCGASRIRKHEWLMAYHAARPLALREKNILSGFRAGGLYPHSPSQVLRHLPPPLETIDMASLEKGMQDLMLTQATPRGPQLHKTNAALRRMLASRRGLTSPAKRYISKLADVSERMEAQLAIAEKEAKEREVLLQARKRQRTGKRLVIKNHIILSTKEIRDGVRAAEAETEAKKKKKGKKGKTIEDPEVIASGDENE